jgi:two-component system response regulator VicR
MGKKVLVIDDDEEILRVVSYILKDDGYSVVKSATGDVMDKLDRLKPDLIILDCCLEGSFGDDLCREIKSHPVHKHIPIILISALSHISFIAKKCNADGFIEKPFDLEQLTGMVRNFLSPVVKHA